MAPMALRGFSLFPATAVVPAKLTVFNGHISRPSFPFSSLKSFVNCSLKTTFKSGSGSVSEHVYPYPIPEFAEIEVQKFREQLSKNLANDREIFGNDFDSVLEVCVKIFGEYLHVEYGGPGTLLVEPFTDMYVALNEKKLPGATLAARTSLLWAQNYLDHDWNIWNSKGSK